MRTCALLIAICSTFMQAMLEELSPYLSFKRLSYVLGYKEAKKLGKTFTVSFPNYDKDTLLLINKICALLPEVGPLISSYIDNDNLLKQHHTCSFRFFKTLGTHTSPMLSLAFDQANSCLYAGGNDGWVRRWNMSKTTHLKAFKAHDREIIALCLHPTQPILYTTGDDRPNGVFHSTIKAWNTDNNTLLRLISLGPYKNIISLTIKNDHLYVGDSRGNICTFDLTGKNDRLHRLFYLRKRSIIGGLDFESSTHNLLIGYGDQIAKKEVTVTSPIKAAGRLQPVAKFYTTKQLTALAVSPAAGHYAYALTGLNDHDIVFYDPTASRKFIHRLDDENDNKNHKGHTNSIWALTFGDQGNTLYSGSHDKKIKIWKSSINFQQAKAHCGIWEWFVLRTLEKEEQEYQKQVFSTIDENKEKL